MNTKWLTDPFHFIAGEQALLLGLVFIASTAAICTVAGVHLDGVIDAHYGPHHQLTITLMEGFVNFIVMFLVLTPIAYYLAGPGFRLIDLLGTQALARAPFIVVALIMLIGQHLGLEQMSQTLAEGVKPSSSDMTLIMTSGFISVLFVGWAIYWMYRSLVICTHSSGGKTIALFMGAVVIAEVVSKVFLQFMYKQLLT